MSTVRTSKWQAKVASESEISHDRAKMATSVVDTELQQGLLGRWLVGRFGVMRRRHPLFQTSEDGSLVHGKRHLGSTFTRWVEAPSFLNFPTNTWLNMSFMETGRGNS